MIEQVYYEHLFEEEVMVTNTVSQQQDLKLTARGRLVAVVMAAVAVCAGVLFADSAVADGPAASQEVSVHIVVTGDTLWGIASAHSVPGVDLRDSVIEIAELNRLDSERLELGQRILVPVS